MKITNILVILLVLQTCIMLYDGLFATPPDYCVGESCYTNYTESAFDSNNSKIWSFVSNPSIWRGSALMVVLLSLGGAVASYIIIGAFLKTPTDTAIFAPLFILILAAGFVPIVGLYNVITRDVGIYGCTIGEFCLPATILWVLTGGVLLLFFLFSALKWWRTGDI